MRMAAALLVVLVAWDGSEHAAHSFGMYSLWAAVLG